MTSHPGGRHLSSLALCALLAAVTLGGCTQKAQTDAQSTTTATVSQPPTTQPMAAATAEPTAVAAQPAATAGAGASAPPQTAATAAGAATVALGTSDGDQTGTKLVVNSLARGSDTVTLKFTLVNDSATEIDTHKFNGANYRGYRSVSGVHLIDTVSKKKYFPVADTEGNCVCSNDVPDVASKTQTSLWVKFPAPPASVKKITVEVPHFMPLDDIPIGQ